MKLPSCPEIKSFFPDFRAPVVGNFVLLVHCILSSRSLSLYKCAEYVPGKARFASNYQRLLRFVRTRHADLFCLRVCELLLSMAPLQKCSYLVIDRTNWKLGPDPINLLCLGLVIGDRFYLPLLWEPLSKHGSSGTKERIRLMKRFRAVKPEYGRYVLLADREFIGRKWMKWLRSQGIGIVIRLREGDYLGDLNRCTGQSLDQIQRHVDRHGRFVESFKLDGYRLYYTVLIDRKIGGDFLYLLSSSPDWKWTQQAYAKRWSIEVFFKQLKSDGFAMEGLRIKDPDRLQILVAAASMAYLVALKEGFIQASKQPIRIKRSPGQGMRWPEVSVFRYGYRSIVRKMRTFKQFIRSVKRLFSRKKRPWIPDQIYVT